MTTDVSEQQHQLPKEDNDVVMQDGQQEQQQQSSSTPTTTSATSKAATTDIVEELPSNRFELELEFIQCLASPAYLHHLATTGVLSDTAFLTFLEYLQYWKKPDYSRFLQYPHCLYFLDLLVHNSTFRRELANVAFRNFVHEQQFYAWQYRASTLYGTGLPKEESTDAVTKDQAESGAAGQGKISDESKIN
mmetsp:Transcript_24806/g.34990  ORF Transcript_24806/g.34990 Transcript_24806/m.34990 type:complete len:191 (-) Transcript_24806:3656-4228(-)